ncbi:uncharacterized protein N0V89_006286 [Didymosphaeria variabile]|uniref:Heterokaryon incompatibility domain-containing protein n=1 Tax=Didymosphaeria variabile TaxID=1932322 RepID=A0A9W9CC98_9PLEO|nr:uncharacterized protein N0V89_006286 [Didymosphaeria variabile]KAJ4354549.1 hypothetical protein N0V89_006286 [Didymosphaeria variabile]
MGEDMVSTRRLLEQDPNAKWGFIVYRCTYERDDQWARFLQYLNTRTRLRLEEQGNGDLFERIDWQVQEDRESFDHAGPRALRRHFTEEVLPTLPNPSTSRHHAFVAVYQLTLHRTLTKAPPAEEFDAYGMGFVTLVSRHENEAIVLAYLALGVLVAVIWTGRARVFRDEEQPLLRPSSPNDTIVNPEDHLLRPQLPSEDSSSSTIYSLSQDLDPQKYEIRILRLHAGVPGCKLEASLQIESLGPDIKPSPYEALSYVWAEIPGEAEIRVDGIQHKITRNLGQALEQFRYSDRDRLLWVDAICINQNHSIERGHQVRLMGTVYARASGVLIWLGAETHDSAQAMRDLETLSEDKHFRQLSFFGSVDDASGDWVPAPTERINPLENLMKRTYWSRVWVVQEIVRSRNATLICGSSSISWDTCLKVRDNWPKHSRTCCNAECTVIDPRMRRVMNWLNSSWKKYSSNNSDLLSTLNQTRALAASDPHDKIFGALGLVDDDPSLLDPDYDSPYTVVFTEWTSHIFKTTQTLDSLLHTNFLLRSPDIPSWVPDWSQYNPKVRFQAERLEHHRHVYNSFNSGGSSGLGSRYFSNGKLLRLGCVHLGTVSSIGQRLVYDREENLTDDQNQIGAIKKWNEVLNTWAHVAGLPDAGVATYPAGNTYKDAYWRTLISDHITEVGTYLGTRISANDYHRYESWRQWFSELVQQPDERKTAFYKDCLGENRDHDRFDWTIMNMNYGRRMFRINNGMIGMGSADMLQGDRVVILCGGRTPFLVRPVDPESASKGQAHQIIGYAYVHGIMHGEAAPANDEGWDIISFV